MTALQGAALILLASQITVSGWRNSSEEKNGFLVFLRQHFIPNFVSLEGVDCSHLMRGSFPTAEECKKVNTFIVSFPDLLMAVCRSKGEPYSNLRRSLDSFDLITCTLDLQQAARSCLYSMHRFSASIAVGCDSNGYPVHFQEGDFKSVIESEGETGLTWYSYFAALFC